MTFSGAGKCLWRNTWLLCGQFGSWIERTSLSQVCQRESILKEKRKLIFGAAFLRQGHKFLGILPTDKWGLCPFPRNLGGLVPALTNGVWWKLCYVTSRVKSCKGMGLPPCSLTYSWNCEPCRETMCTCSGWQTFSHPSPDTSHLREGICRWFLFPALLGSPRYCRADTNHVHFVLPKSCLTVSVSIVKWLVLDATDFWVIC